MATETMDHGNGRTPPKKLHGRGFYESLGSPKYILAPMVAQSEYAWRRLTRSFMTSKQDEGLVAYSPMLHARMFADNPKYRDQHFQPLTIPMSELATQNGGPAQSTDQKPAEEFLDGNKRLDRPLFVQFCANEPDALLEAARKVQAHCDAVDLNLGCPQGIAKRGHYGSFLQEDQPLIYRLVNKLHLELDIPVTAKMRILDTPEKTLEYAKLLLDAGASIITVHGRTREQKGHKTGVADWTVLRYLRERLPPETVIFANGNVLQHGDLHACLKYTGVDGVMSAEGNLYDPAIFAIPPPIGEEGREYWRGADGKGGYRMDAVMRRYMDIIHREVLCQDSPVRAPLWILGDPIPAPAPILDHSSSNNNSNSNVVQASMPDTRGTIDDGPPPTKKQKRNAAAAKKQSISKPERCANVNLTGMQAHLFNLLRPLVAKHTYIRDALARVRAGDMRAFESILSQVEEVTRQGIQEYATQDLEATKQTANEPVAAMQHGAETPAAVVATTPARSVRAHATDTGHEAVEANATAAIEDRSAELTVESGPSTSSGTASRSPSRSKSVTGGRPADESVRVEDLVSNDSSTAAQDRCRRPWFVCQPYVRPLPVEALAKGAIQLSKKDLRALQEATGQERDQKQALGQSPSQCIIRSDDIADGTEHIKGGGKNTATSNENENVNTTIKERIEVGEFGAARSEERSGPAGDDGRPVEGGNEGLVCG